MLMYAPVKTLKDTLNREIVKAMQEEGITNAELARRMNCSPPTCLLMVQNKRNLQLDTVERLAKALGRTVEIAFVKNGNKKGRDGR